MHINKTSYIHYMWKHILLPDIAIDL